MKIKFWTGTAIVLAATLLFAGTTAAKHGSDNGAAEVESEGHSPAASMAMMSMSPAPSVAPAATASASASVTIHDFAFGPGSISVAVGSTVTWTNQDSVSHTVTADDGSFDSGRLAQGATFSQTFDTPGTYTYHCAIHPSMTGTITVEAGPAPSVAPAATASASASVTIQDFAFGPGSISVAVGSTVTWTNQDSVSHTVTADDGSFDSGRLAQGATFSQTFDTPGTYTYHCAIHPSMTGTITVE